MRLIHSLLLLSLLVLAVPTPIAGAQTPTIDLAPILVAPTDGSSGDGSPRFEWQAVDGAATYRIEIAADSEFSEPLATAETADVRYQEPDPFDDGAVLHWRVSVVHEGLDPVWSDAWTYQVTDPATATPEPTATETTTPDATSTATPSETATSEPTHTATATTESTETTVPPTSTVTSTPTITETPTATVTATATPKPVVTPVAISKLTGALSPSTGYPLTGVGRSRGSVHPSVLTDRDRATIWTSPATYPASGYVIVAMDEVRSIGEIRWLFGQSGRADRIVIEVSTDRASWREVGRARNGTVGEWQSLSVATRGRYVRFRFVNIRGDRWLGGLVEIEVHPPKAQPTPTPSPSPVTREPASDGIVRNASFEDGARPWYLESGASISTRHAYGGETAIELRASGGFADQAVSLTRGSSYELSAWGAFNRSYDQAYVGVVFRDADGVRLTNLEPDMIEFSRKTYQQKRIQFQVDSRVARVTVFVWKEAGGAYFFADDIVLRRIGEITSSPPRQIATCQGLVVPGYFDPEATSLWQETAATGAGVRMVIFNPNSGVGDERDQAWVDVVASSRAAGFTVLAYVQTDYGNRSASAVVGEIDQYRRWYGVKDFFLDEADPSFSSVENYRSMVQNIHNGGGKAVLNFGWMPHPAYMQFTDVAGVFESTYSEYRNDYDRPDWFYSYPATRFLHIVHSTPATSWQTAMDLSRQRNAGYLWVTDDDTVSYYKSLPSFWTSINKTVTATC
jgi:hypothetical protein